MSWIFYQIGNYENGKSYGLKSVELFNTIAVYEFRDQFTRVMVCIAALLIPLHHKLEHWVTHKLVEKNNRIRLAAAKKTIASIEGQSGEGDV